MTKAVAMNDFTAEAEGLRESQLAACDRVFRSGWWVLGNEVFSFEEAWSNFLAASYVVGCGNGLDAIEIGLRAIGVSAGDEVITSPMTAFATVLGILRAGAIPVLADIDPKTGVLDPSSVHRCISASTKAVLQVHLYGQMVFIDDFLEIAHSHKIHYMEDCAQSHGAKWNGRAAGTIGSFGAWSFYPTKNLGTVGDGGALTTGLTHVAESARELRNYGQTRRYHHARLGMNSRLDELQAAILKERLPYLTAWNKRRRSIARQYAAEIANDLVTALPLPADQERHVHHLFVVNSERRDELQMYLKENLIESLIHYPIPIHRQNPCSSLRRDPEGLSYSEQHAATCLSLPCHPGLSEEDVARVISVVNNFRI